MSSSSQGLRPFQTERTVVASWQGRVPYLDGWRLQDAVASRVRGGDDERILLLEHDPVYTIGRRGTVDNLLVDLTELRALGASLYRVDRGGDITYHGPGQLVGYPIVRLGDRPDLVRYVRALESSLIAVLDEYAIAARTEKGKTGVWVDLLDGRPAKIAAIGVRVSRGVTTHGFALNVSTDLAAFGRMVPCGFMHEVASLARLGVRAEVRDVATRVVAALARELTLSVIWGTTPPPDDGEIPEDAPVRHAEDLTRVVVAA